MALWKECSSPSLCHSLDLFSVMPSSTPYLLLVCNQLVCLQSIVIFKHYVYSFIYSFICGGTD